MKIDKFEKLRLSYIEKVQDLICYRKRTKAVWACWHAVIRDTGFPMIYKCLDQYKLRYYTRKLYDLQSSYEAELRKLKENSK